MQVHHLSGGKEEMKIKSTEEVKDKLIAAIRAGRASIFFDESWKYPDDDTPGYIEFVNRVRGGSQKTIPILDMLFNVERVGGFILKIRTEDAK